MAAVQSEIQFAVVAATTLGDNTLVASVTGKRLRVVSYVLVASGGANTVRFESGASGTALTGLMDVAADGQLVAPYNPEGWFQTAAAALLNLELAAGTSVAGHLSYVEVT